MKKQARRALDVLLLLVLVLLLTEALDVLHVGDVARGDEVDRDSLAAETTRATNAVDVVLAVGGEVEVDDQGDLLDVDAAGQEIGGDEDAGGAGPEVAHDVLSLLHLHVAVGGGHGEVPLGHLLGEPVDLAPGVAVDDGLRDLEGVVQVAEGVELPLLLLDGDVELRKARGGKKEREKRG